MSRSTPARQSARGSRQEWKVSGSTSALSPPFVNAGVRFLSPFPGKGGIVGKPFGAAAIVSGRIVGVEAPERNRSGKSGLAKNLRPKAIRSAFSCWN